MTQGKEEMGLFCPYKRLPEVSLLIYFFLNNKLRASLTCCLLPSMARIGLPIATALQYVIVVQETLVLAQSPVPLHQGPVVRQEPNEMATKHFQCPVCVTAVLEDSGGCVTQLQWQEVTAWLCPQSMPSAWHHREEHVQWEKMWVGEKRKSSPEHPLQVGCGFQREKILRLVPDCVSHPTPMPPIVFCLGLYVLSWMISALV